jgi:predicted metal-dependent enzyme (double-stranded beta helix superfamily)
MASIQQTVIASHRIERLRDFVGAFSHLVETAPSEPDILRTGSRLLKDLISVDDWLPVCGTIRDRVSAIFAAR